MVDTNLPFDSDRFVRDLPELLSGRDPILERPVARRWIGESAEGRRAVHQIVGALTVLEDAPTQVLKAFLPSTSSIRGIKIAAKHFPRRLADALRCLLIHEMVVRSENGPTVLVGGGKDLTLRTRARGEAEWNECIQLQNSRFAKSTEVCPAQIPTEDGAMPVIHPEIALEAVVRLDPGQPNDAYALECLYYLERRGNRVSALSKLAHSTQSLKVVAQAATLRGIMLVERGELRDAIESLERGAERAETLGLAAYNGLLCSVKMRSIRNANRFLSRLENGLDALPEIAGQLSLQFLADSVAWREVGRIYPFFLQRVMALLGRQA